MAEIQRRVGRSKARSSSWSKQSPWCTDTVGASIRTQVFPFVTDIAFSGCALRNWFAVKSLVNLLSKSSNCSTLLHPFHWVLFWKRSGWFTWPPCDGSKIFLEWSVHASLVAWRWDDRDSKKKLKDLERGERHWMFSGYHESNRSVLGKSFISDNVEFRRDFRGYKTVLLSSIAFLWISFTRESFRSSETAQTAIWWFKPIKRFRLIWS